MTDTTTSLPQAPLSKTATSASLERFTREGCVKVGPLLEAAEVDALKAAIDRAYDDPRAVENENRYSDFVMTRMFEFDRMFRDLMVREPLISLMEALLGSKCHLMANNAVRNRPGEAIAHFHVDDELWFPLPADIPQFDARMTFPTFAVTAQIALTDITTDAHGPTQYVPGSHYSGRHPNDTDWPTFEGQGPVSLHARAGEVYLQHPQVWHRGAPNTSDRTRYLLQYSYSRRFISQRFYPFLNYRMPDHVLEGAGPRLLRVLGKHGKGAYG